MNGKENALSIQLRRLLEQVTDVTPGDFYACSICPGDYMAVQVASFRPKFRRQLRVHHAAHFLGQRCIGMRYRRALCSVRFHWQMSDWGCRQEGTWRTNAWLMPKLRHR
jgi:hypothetical protein